MIIDPERFLRTRRPLWDELEAELDHLENDPGEKLGLRRIERFHYLYQAAAADLSRIETFAAEIGLRRKLEALVARAYAEIHELRRRPTRFSPVRWLLVDFPRVFRRRIRAFWLAVAVMLIGSAFGSGALVFDPASKPTLLGAFSTMHGGKPSDRVRMEESTALNSARDAAADAHGRFSAQLMTNNIRVSINAMALGMTWGIGTLILLFYNGVILGAISADYIMDGQGVFLTGWLLPHGSIEIPAILIAAQAGLALAGALIGWGDRKPLRRRLRETAPELGALISGVAAMLVWAGFIEAFFSQYHAPVIPYSVKIAFGSAELIALAMFLAFAGRRPDSPESAAEKAAEKAGRGIYA